MLITDATVERALRAAEALGYIARTHERGDIYTARKVREMYLDSKAVRDLAVLACSHSERAEVDGKSLCNLCLAVVPQQEIA